VQQQYGMITGSPMPGSSTRSPPSTYGGERYGHLPRRLRHGTPPRDRYRLGAAGMRAIPQASRCARTRHELDATYGRRPDLEKMPMYGVVSRSRIPFDTKDMRNDSRGRRTYDIDFRRARPYPLGQLRDKGRNHFRQGRLQRIQRTGRRFRGGQAQTRKGVAVGARYQAEQLGRQTPPTRTTRRAPLARLQLGVGVSVSANLVMCSLGEETRASTRGPAISQCVDIDPAAQIAAQLKEARSAPTSIATAAASSPALIADARQGPRRAEGSRDRLLRPDAIPTPPCRGPRWLATSYASHARARGSLKGMRIGVIRESMLIRPGGQRPAEPISIAAAAEMKAVLARSSAPLW